ncbi:pelargonidin 3-O-(6-caffeoylglucoside) 5-O-(6-O-malonylglucoside) 4'''-malonyltransferase-like [Rutidosis leptorrhynchoides]|uniref:pelargonidin 3-O-(6-caffeoylglucoside) 5-O-(6-O-malonylglucoside) 4'''-malonyltransferase-like n=1 Tax=Rutidosis leptorrhynchoides TaxID=125765 RepID=UPI003A99F0C7
MKISKQSSTFIKPFVPTPQTHHRYKLGFLDEVAPFWNVDVVLFFSPICDQNRKFVVGLEKSLEKTLTRLYPLAGRYVDETQVIECNDEGVEFIHAKVNIKLHEFLELETDTRLVDEFISFKTRGAHNLTGPLLSIQVTKFECGGVAVGVRATHKIVDASTLCTFLNVWAAINREENEIKFSWSGFNSSSIFPARGLRAIDVPTISGDMLAKFTRKSFSFTEYEISKIRANAAFASGNVNSRHWSKVQLVMAILSKAFIDVDRAVYKYSRESMVMQTINLRGKMASLIHKNSCGNLWAYCFTKSGNFETTIELADVISDSVKKALNNYSKVHHDTEEGKSMVWDPILMMANFNPESTHLIGITSWCKFSFYEANFGFGKPIWVAPGTVPLKNVVTLMDDASGNGVVAHVLLENIDVPIFEESLNTNALRA